MIGGYDFSDYTDRTAVGDLENSLATLAFREDSRDWYRRKGLSFGLEMEEIQNLLLRLEFRSDEHATMPKKVVAPKRLPMWTSCLRPGRLTITRPLKWQIFPML